MHFVYARLVPLGAVAEQSPRGYSHQGFAQVIWLFLFQGLSDFWEGVHEGLLLEVRLEFILSRIF